MSLTLYAHPFSSYSQKVLIALYENETPFTYRMLGPEDPEAGADWAALWPMKRMPVLVDAGTAVLESTVIIEHLGLFHPGPVRLLPTDAKAALAVRMMNRYFDNYVMTPMQAIVFDHLRPAGERDPYGVARAREQLDDAYRWLDGALAQRHWACGDDFTLADCAAAPSLFYADWVHRIDTAFGHVRAYRARLLARPSFARAVDEARPFRKLFPPGAPDRD
ncbi:glutathione S-transferase family protein [Bosea sp. NBC_00550]|uniref:glutathione S-transferase family protein n=1 Tax=Bosea sp. NBC_00550 TaxID=2969621 RepID=UPI0022322E18|nr:glutathione S-transferase family protein [Bosea sp. NBC_00550]UZF93044.1 glutathione S-transferase family protein [Bosea sp. NBC_00550]